MATHKKAQSGFEVWSAAARSWRHAGDLTGAGGAATATALSNIFRSINELQRELQLPGGTRGLRDHPEARAPHHVCRQTKVHQVEHVEKLGPELEGGGLARTP